MKTDLRSLDFIVNRFVLLNYLRLLVEMRQQSFSFRLSSDILQKHSKKYLDNIIRENS